MELYFLKNIKTKIVRFYLKYINGNILIQYIISARVFRKYYKTKNITSILHVKADDRKIIYTADGRRYAGGLADRLKGIVSLYKISKEINVGFWINFTSPFVLEEYLIPNKYDWVIHNRKEINYDVKNAVIFDFFEGRGGETVMRKIQSLFKKWNQIHITSNICIAVGEEFGKLFNELFKPTEELNYKIHCCLSEINSDFISVTFRFRQLLGDFLEIDTSIILPDNEKLNLINRCIDHLKNIYKENEYRKIFVTSDSIIFLNSIKELDFVYIVPGKIAHTDHPIKFGKEVYMKSFLDFFLLTHSKKIYQVIDGLMYTSGFPYTASLICNQPYICRTYE